MRPHYSQSSYENATPSSGTFPLASYKEVQPLPSPPPPRAPSPDETTRDFSSTPAQKFDFSCRLCYQSGLGVCWVGSIARLKFLWIIRLLPPQKSRFSNFDSNSIVFTTTKGICYQLISIFSLLCFIFSLNWIKQPLKETENGTPHYICIGNSMICSDIWHKYHE